MTVGNQPVLLDSPFGLEFKKQSPFAHGLAIGGITRPSADETWERVWGKRKEVLPADVDFEVGRNTATMKYFVDLGAEMPAHL